MPKFELMSETVKEFTLIAAQDIGYTMHCKKCDSLLPFIWAPPAGIRLYQWCDKCQKELNQAEMNKKDVK